MTQDACRWGRLACRFISVLLLIMATATNGVAQVTEIGPSDDLEAAVAALSPGEELVLRGGNYQFDENVTLRANGTAQQLITIRVKDGERAIISQATDRQNVVEINGCLLYTSPSPRDA